MNHKELGRTIPILLLFLFLTTVLVTSFHHHADMRDHSACAICKVVKGPATNDTPQIFHLPLPQKDEELIVYEVIKTRQHSFFILQHSRAPPKNSSL
jgi:hypothetical protein